MKSYRVTLIPGDGVGPELAEHREARRLIRLLSFFFTVTDAEIPLNSILREFIGKSCFFE